MIKGIVTTASQGLRDNVRKRWQGGAVELMIASYLAAAIGLLTSIIATWLSSPTEYGAAALIMSFPSLLWSIASFKPSSIATRYIVRYRTAGQHEQVLSICKLGYLLDLLASTAVFLLIVVANQWIARIVHGAPDQTWLMIAFAASIPLFSLMGTSLAIFSSWQAFRWLAVFLVLERVLTLVLTVSLLITGWSVAGLVIAIAIAQALTGVASAVVAVWILARDGSSSWWRARVRLIDSLRSELAAMFSWNYAISTLSGVTTQVPLMIIGRLSGVDEAGYYRLGLTIATVAGYIEQSLAKIAYPKLSTWYASARTANYYTKLRSWTMSTGVPAAVLVVIGIVFLPVMVPVVFSEAYTPIVLGTQILLVSVAARTLFFWLTPHYYAAGQLKSFTFWYFLYTVISLILSWSVAQRWGYIGIALVNTGSYILLIAVLLLSVKVLPRIRLSSKELAE